MRLLRSRYLDATLPMPRQPLLRTQRAPFPPDRSAGAVNAYSPKPIHQVGFAHPSLYNRKKFTSPYLSTVGAAARETVQILRARHLDVTLTMNPRQPLLRTRRAPFPPDRSAGAVNAYPPKRSRPIRSASRIHHRSPARRCGFSVPGTSTQPCPCPGNHFFEPDARLSRLIEALAL